MASLSMKYMGSKRSMLLNGLGEALEAACINSTRVVDLFTGSGAVAYHAAEKYDCVVIANDLQQYSAALANAVISRTEVTRANEWWPEWKATAKTKDEESELWTAATSLQKKLADLVPAEAAEKARRLSERAPVGSICRAYGGHYFSPLQALWFDNLRANLPAEADRHAVALGALIQAASKCAASPGHTAQPFKANETAGPFLIEAWMRNVPEHVLSSATALGKRRARAVGRTYTMDALELAKETAPGDLVFIDPPYSAVHYSRFYHVLETLARGGTGDVSGTGRYPPPKDRPISDFSIASKATSALKHLLKTVSGQGARAMVTFPAEQASNGLSGDRVREIAEEFFVIEVSKVTSRFSTMGGDRKHRAARHDAHELILTLLPR